jgi:hypothetical protein
MQMISITLVQIIRFALEKGMARFLLSQAYMREATDYISILQQLKSIQHKRHPNSEIQQ